MTNVILISDIHFGLRIDHAILDAGGGSSDRLRDVREVMLSLYDYVSEVRNNISAVFILGDLFHRRHPKAPALIAAGRALAQLAKLVPVYILPGNHDAHDRSGKLYSLQVYEELSVPGIYIWKHGSKLPIDGRTFRPMPWLPEPKFKKALTEVSKEDDDETVLLFHQQVVNCYDAGWKIEGGISKDELALAGYAGYWSGHVHVPQSFGMGVPGGYLGSPLHFAFGEVTPDNPSRGFWVLDTDTLETTAVAVNTAPAFHRWDFSAYEDMDCVEVVEEVLPGLKEEITTLLADVPAYLRIRVQGPRAIVSAATARLRAALGPLQATGKGIRLLAIQEIQTDAGAGERLRKVMAGLPEGEALDPPGLVAAYVGAAATEKNAAVQEELTRIGRELLGEGRDL